MVAFSFASSHEGHFLFFAPFPHTRKGKHEVLPFPRWQVKRSAAPITSFRHPFSFAGYPVCRFRYPFSVSVNVVYHPARQFDCFKAPAGHFDTYRNGSQAMQRLYIFTSYLYINAAELFKSVAELFQIHRRTVHIYRGLVHRSGGTVQIIRGAVQTARRAVHMYPGVIHGCF